MENINNLETERYVRKDIKGGFLYNRSEIEYYKQMQSLDVIDNMMFGDYNASGEYAIDKEVIDTLINMTKLYQYSFGANLFCQSAKEVGKYGRIDFAINIVKNTPKKGYATAILELLEPIDRANGYYTNTNTAQIASYVAIESGSFVTDALRNFNVSAKRDDALAKKITEEDITALLNRKQYLEALKNVSFTLIDREYKIILEKKMKALSKSAVGKEIIEKFNDESYKVNGWFIKEDATGYYKYLNQILDSLIEQMSEKVFEDVKLKATLNKINDEASKQIGAVIARSSKALIEKSDIVNEELVNLYRAEQKKTEENKANSKPIMQPVEKQAEKPVEKTEATKSNSQAETQASVFVAATKEQVKKDKSKNKVDDTSLNYFSGTAEEMDFGEKQEISMQTKAEVRKPVEENVDHSQKQVLKPEEKSLRDIEKEKEQNKQKALEEERTL